jgi:ABC-2 type transport system permease protein
MSSPSVAPVAFPAETGPGGVIHDIGYRRYTGPRLGRAYAVRSLYVHGLRTAFGLGRSAGAKVFPWGVFGVLMGVAAILVAVQSQVSAPGTRLIEYWQYPDRINVLVLLFCAVAAPELVSRDLRGGVLPLYFSRPLTRTDYALSKWASLISAVFLLLLGPLLLLFLGTAFSLPNMTAVWHELIAFSQGLATVAITAALFGSIALLISSLSSRRAVAAAITVGVFIVTTPVVGVLQALSYAQSRGGPRTGSALTLAQLSFLASPLTIVNGISDWLFNDKRAPNVGPYGPLYVGAAAFLIVLCVGLTLLRYRKVAR